jgi:hypothetical protein
MQNNKLLPLKYAICILSLIVFVYVYDKTEIREITHTKKVDTISIILKKCYNLTDKESIFYSSLFQTYSKKHKIDWMIYPSIISIESNWKSKSKSEKGAIGLMQIMEPTFEEYCKKMNIKYKKNKTIHNDSLNLIVGMEYISIAIKRRGMERGVKSYIGGYGYHHTNKDCKIYYHRFKREYSKIKKYHNLKLDLCKKVHIL